MSYVPDAGLCEWVNNGQRCHYAGTISDSTTGGGPWFCRHHHGLGDAAHGARIVVQSLHELPSPDYGYEARRAASFQAAKRRIPASLFGWHRDEYRDYAKSAIAGIGRGGGKPWPVRVLERVRSGEVIPQIARKWAAEWHVRHGLDVEAEELRA